MRSTARGTSRRLFAHARRGLATNPLRRCLWRLLRRTAPRNAAQHLIEDDAERKEIAAAVDEVAEDLLRRHIRWRAVRILELLGREAARRGDPFRDSRVADAAGRGRCAIPKSISFTIPARESRILPGLMSR